VRRAKDWAAGTGVAITMLLALEGILRLFGVHPQGAEAETTLEDGVSVPVAQQDVERLPASVVNQWKRTWLNVPDAELIFRVRPNPSGEPIEGHLGINALGFRGDPFDLETKKKRIMMLGDSCAFGWQVKRLEDTIASSLERLRADYAVFDLAQPGYSTTQGVILFDRWFDRIHPDVVVLYFGWNDIWPTKMLTDRQTIQLIRAKHSAVLGALVRSRVYASLQWIMRKLGIVEDPSAGVEVNPKERLPPNERPRVPIDEVLANFDHLASRTKTIVILPPYLSSSSHVLTFIDPFNEKVRAHLQGRVTFLGLGAMRPGAIGAERYFAGDGYHPSEAGARLIAEEIAQEIGTGTRTGTGTGL
jgi:lysophospholipase L1-like esterase